MSARAESTTVRAVVIPESDLAAPVISRDVAACEWVLHARYEYFDRQNCIAIPAGFRFDLASIPRPLWWLLAPFELSISAPLIHDWLYQAAGAPDGAGYTYTRAEADALFRRVMKAEGISAWRRTAAYAAVRSFGGGAWRD